MDHGWMPGWLAEWSDRNPDFRTFVPFFVLGGLAVFSSTVHGLRAMRGDRLVLFLSVASVVLIGIELVQWPMATRFARIADVGWGLLGILCGAGVCSLAWLVFSGWFADRGEPNLETGLRIRIWGINYFPEMTGIAPMNTRLAEWLAGQGHAVSMVSTFPYYPTWRKVPGDRRYLFLADQLNGVELHRVWHYVPPIVSTVKRMLHEGSFLVFSTLRALTLPRADVVVVVSPPLGLGLTAFVCCGLRRERFIFHVQDLQPDAAVGLGMVEEGRMIRFLYWLESFAYKRAVRVSGISEGMVQAFMEKGVPEAKTVHFPNPVELPNLNERPDGSGFRERETVDPSVFLVVYSGNIGVKQGLDQVLAAAELLREDPGVLFLICGDGAARAGLGERAQQRGLENIRFLPLQPELRFHEMLMAADLLLVTQQAGSGAAFFPSKLLTLLAMERPVLAVADQRSVVREVLVENGAGLVTTPGDTSGFLTAIQFARENPEQLRELGERGRRFVERYDSALIYADFESMLRGVALG